ncbi:hypothetical protein POVWA2_025210 [Plasmodium ovale wallikeri]|uniref:Uncharacterized protein n=2 Tax=Plasmodium ovale TaxID=36330 RepID=A0A1A8YUC0_PLAOA|nr:hypothetical protein POVWA1_025390 [Plasmodium ovale wallikeri]SBT35478.1 hypothetical protein POVWA2_025210 [Plasmodium ovale wallikeri]SBT77017.1 conserved Plasmodium protein, unknown function [Plasmodium ovale]
MSSGSTEEKNGISLCINRVKFPHVTGDSQTDKRIEYLWNLAISSIYENAKLSMKYVTLIKKITKNSLLLDNICCNYCNLIYIPFYNCEIKEVKGKNSMLYKCFLCNNKRKLNLQNFNQSTIKSEENISEKLFSNKLTQFNFFRINEIDDHEIKKDHKGQDVEKEASFNEVIDKSNAEEESMNGIDCREDSPIELIWENCDSETNKGENLPSDLHSNNEEEDIFSQKNMYEDMKNLFRIDYGTNTISSGRNDPFLQLNLNEKNQTLDPLHADKKPHDVKALHMENNLQKKRKRDVCNNGMNKADSGGVVDAARKAIGTNKRKEPDRTQHGDNSVTGDNFLNFNKKKKRKNILDIL